jgi:hypothetical protein
VRDEDLLREGEGPAEALARRLELGGHGLVQAPDLIYRHGGPP